MTGIINTISSKTRTIGKADHPYFELSTPSGKTPDIGMLIGFGKGDLMPNIPLIGIKKTFDVTTSATNIDVVNVSNVYYGGFFVVVGDRGAGRFIDVLVAGMTSVSSAFGSLTVKDDGGSSLDSRTYTCSNQLHLAMGGHSGEYNVATFCYLGYPTAS